MRREVDEWDMEKKRQKRNGWVGIKIVFLNDWNEIRAELSSVIKMMYRFSPVEIVEMMHCTHTLFSVEGFVQVKTKKGWNSGEIMEN